MLKPRARGESGVSLAELVVTSSIMLIVMSMALMYFLRINTTSKVTVARNINVGQARVALDTITTSLRVADWQDHLSGSVRVEELTSTKLVYFANIANRSLATVAAGSSVSPATDPTKIIVQFVPTQANGDGGLFLYTMPSPYTTTSSVRQLIPNIQAPTGPLFAPYKADGTAVTISASGCFSSAVSTTVPGLCHPAPVGMVDPDMQSNPAVADGACPTAPVTTAAPLSVHPGCLSGVAASSADLNSITRVTISFTVTDSSHVAAMDFTSSASFAGVQ